MKFSTLRNIIFCGLLSAAAIPFVGPTQKALALSGSDFNPARIIDDSTFFNSNTMSPTDIQIFLNNKVPICRQGYTCLKDYTQPVNSIAPTTYCGGITGGTKSSATIIFEVARACGINPQTLLVMLEKEQGLVTDDWPVEIQYRSAMGYGCPDTAACDTQYYGLFNQVYNAAKQLNKYVQQPQQFNYAAGRTSLIQYNPNSACGGANVTINNGATAALYNYTPYQPNTAALNNLRGSGDSCSAYGNRNFWVFFNNWFGPTTGDGYVVATPDNGDTRQWVVQGGKKFLIPSPEMVRAWGLSTPTTFPGTYLGSIPDGPNLSRLMRPPGISDVYFVDNGNCYKVTSPEMLAAWSMNPSAIDDVSGALSRLPKNQGNLSYALRKQGSPAVYMMDGGTIRQYSNPDILASWEGDSPKIVDLSSDYSTAVGSPGTLLSSTKAKSTSNATQYNIVAGQKLVLSSGISLLYPGTPATVSDATISRLVTSAPATYLVKGVNSPTVYLVDASTKHAIPSQELLRAWGVGSVPVVNVVTQGNLNLLTTGAAINTYEADVSGQLYLMDGRKILVPSSLDSGYRTSNNVYSASSSLMDVLPVGETASNFLKDFHEASVYLMDSGTLRHIRTPDDLNSLNNNENITAVSGYVVNQFAGGATIGSYVSDGSTNYVLDKGIKYSVNTSVAADWNLVNPDTIAVSTAARLPGTTALPNSARNGSAYYLVKSGKSYITFNSDLASVWGISTAPSLSTTFLQRVTPDIPLTIFVRSTDINDQRIFLADNGGTQLYHLTNPSQVYNFGWQDNGKILKLRPAEISAASIVSAQNLVKKASGGESVIDSGARRILANSAVVSKWVTASNISTISDSLWSFIPAGASISATVKEAGPPPEVYTIETGQKRWIQNPSTYQELYAPYQTIGGFLYDLLPAGPNIP